MSESKLPKKCLKCGENTSERIGVNERVNRVYKVVGNGDGYDSIGGMLEEIYDTEEIVGYFCPKCGEDIVDDNRTMSTGSAFQIVYDLAKGKITKKMRKEQEALDVVHDFLVNNIYE